MKETFSWLFWRLSGEFRNKSHDAETDCPCCGLALPWPQQAHTTVEKSGRFQKVTGEVVHWLKGERHCPRCRHEWNVIVQNCNGVYTLEHLGADSILSPVMVARLSNS